MPRKTRRSSSSRKNTSLFGWPRVLIVIIPLLAVFLIMTNSSNGRAVLGLSDSNLLNFSKKEMTTSEKSKQKVSCNRVTSFSASTICERSDKEKANNAFKSYNYTCEDGTSGSLEQTQVEGRCVPIEKAYELARKACHKKCIPTKTPKPIRAEPTKLESNL